MRNTKQHKQQNFFWTHSNLLANCNWMTHREKITAVPLHLTKEQIYTQRCVETCPFINRQKGRRQNADKLIACSERSQTSLKGPEKERRWKEEKKPKDKQRKGTAVLSNIHILYRKRKRLKFRENWSNLYSITRFLRTKKNVHKLNF